MTADSARLFLALVRAIARLALPASDQIEYLSTIGVGGLADELGLELGDGAQHMSEFVSQGWLTSREADLISELVRLLDSISGEEFARFWRDDGLTSPEWGTIRNVAKQFLFLQGQ
jgi:hypothetical protein